MYRQILKAMWNKDEKTDDIYNSKMKFLLVWGFSSARQWYLFVKFFISVYGV